MKCPNCGKEIKKKNCIFCGYIVDTGYIIDKNKKGEPNLLDTYLGYKYDKIVRNKNWLSTLLLGPLYISIKGFILHGIILLIIDIFLFYCFFIFNNYFFIAGLSTISNIMLVIVNRIIWMTLDNIIYINLLEKRLNKIKKNNPNNYLELIDKESKTHNDILSFIFTFCLISIFLLIVLLMYLNK